jgi:TRAP-type transport system periplasmic protein
MRAARRRFLKLAGAAAVVAAPTVTRSAPTTPAPEFRFKLHHFVPAVAKAHARFLLPWAKKIEAQSNGRVRIDMFPSMQLGGTPANLYDQVLKGVADIAWIVPSATPGRFPLIETFELPFTASSRAAVNSAALQDFAQQHLMQEFRDVRPLCFWAHDGGVIHAKKQVGKLEDLKDLRLRAPTRLAGDAVRALGANPVSMPVPQITEGLIQRIIDGCLLPWEVVPTVRVQELAKYHTELPGSPALYTATFVLAMNKAKYDALPGDLKAVFDANSGKAASAVAGQLWDEEAASALAAIKARGNPITTVTADEAARWRKAIEPVTDAWVKQLKDRGHDGRKLIAAATALLAKYDKA